MKLFGRTKNRITKDKNDENIPNLEITEEVVMIINKNQQFYIYFFKINHLVNY